MQGKAQAGGNAIIVVQVFKVLDKFDIIIYTAHVLSGSIWDRGTSNSYYDSHSLFHGHLSSIAVATVHIHTNKTNMQH